MINFNDNSNIKLGVIGCGKMATAILKGVCNNNFLNGNNIYCYDINSSASSSLADEIAAKSVENLDDVIKTADVILLATKPFVFDDVISKIKISYKNQLILSILTGIKLEKYQKNIQDIKIVRIMPNTPALVNEAMSALCPASSLSQDEFNFAYNFMSNCGKVIKTTEDKIDIITALSGSGPAFYFKIIDTMAKSAQKLGLDYKEAILLSVQTAFGSAKMLMQNDFNVEQLIKNVTTPGGCTEVGNRVLNSSKLEEILDETIKSTMQKAIELG